MTTTPLLHYGTPPTDPHLIAEILKAHARGYRTILSDDYEVLDLIGLELHQVFQPVAIESPTP